MSKGQGKLFDTASPCAFGEKFLHDHAGTIVHEARVAIIELVSNAYDAGATRVDVHWPEKSGESFAVQDNGSGMSRAEFAERWFTFPYDRTKSQGLEVKFPPKVRGHKRFALGQNGKGRHAPFCFADRYTIETWQNGKGFSATVELTAGGSSPFNVVYHDDFDRTGHGTRISAIVERKRMNPDDLPELIGTKFLVDPSFNVFVNDTKVELLDLAGLETTTIPVEGLGEVIAHCIDASQHTRTMRLRGVTWWVNKHRIGEPSWDRLDGDGSYLDGRTEVAKRFSFVIEADFLKPAAKPDSSGFFMDGKVKQTYDAVDSYVLKRLTQQLASTRKEKKIAALQRSRELLGEMPRLSKKILGKFIDEVQEKCPNMSERDLSKAVHVLANLEQSRSGYDILTQLANCSPKDLDKWNEIMQKWNASAAEVVLDELERRLRLIERMQALVNSKTTDELHELQPLFERGLWIFGPEFESVDFRSNRGLTEVIANFLGPTDFKAEEIRRPDFVILPESSIGAYGQDDHDDEGEVVGFKKVVVIELKKGGFELTQKEVDQARNYCITMRQAGKVQKTTQVFAYVLGASLGELETLKVGATTTVIPMIYDTVLMKAHRRTFNLHQKLKAVKTTGDTEVEQVVKQGPAADKLPFAE